MFRTMIKWFRKGDEDDALHLPKEENTIFILKVDGINMGTLHCENGEWVFKYTDEFKNHSDVYNLIIGFPDLNTEYRSPSLWPFFKTRIPGLKQPAVQEIIKDENIDPSNEVALLKRFGNKTITNTFTLVTE